MDTGPDYIYWKLLGGIRDRYAEPGDVGDLGCTTIITIYVHETNFYSGEGKRRSGRRLSTWR